MPVCFATACATIHDSDTPALSRSVDLPRAPEMKRSGSRRSPVGKARKSAVITHNELEGRRSRPPRSRRSRGARAAQIPLHWFRQLAGEFVQPNPLAARLPVRGGFGACEHELSTYAAFWPALQRGSQHGRGRPLVGPASRERPDGQCAGRCQDRQVPFRGNDDEGLVAFHYQVEPHLTGKQSDAPMPAPCGTP